MLGLAVVLAVWLSTYVWVVVTKEIGWFLIRKYALKPTRAWPFIWLISVFLVSLDTFVGIPYALYECHLFGGFHRLSQEKVKGVYIDKTFFYDGAVGWRWSLEKREQYPLYPSDEAVVKYIFRENSFAEFSNSVGDNVRWTPRLDVPGCAERAGKKTADLGESDKFIKQCVAVEQISGITAEGKIKYSAKKWPGLPVIEKMSLEADGRELSRYVWVRHQNRSYLPALEIIFSLFIPKSCGCSSMAIDRLISE